MNKQSILTFVAVLAALFIPQTASARRSSGGAPAREKIYASTRDEPKVYDPYEIVAARTRQRIEQTSEKLEQFAQEANDFDAAKPAGRRARTPELRLAAFCKAAERNFAWFVDAGAPPSDARLLGFGGRSPEEIAAFDKAAKAFTKVAAAGQEVCRQNDPVKIKAKIAELADAFSQGKKVWLAKIESPIAAKLDGPIILDDVRLLGPYHKNGIPQKVYYQGQAAQKGTIDLVPSSAFFKGFQGEGNLPAFPNDHFGRGAFQFLSKAPFDEKTNADNQTAQQSEIEETKKLFRARGSSQRDVDDLDEPNGAFLPIARWHLYCPKPGEIRTAIYLKVSAEQAREPWIIEMAEGDQIEDRPMTKLEMESETLHLQESDGGKPQPETLTFQVKQPGRVSFYLSQLKMPKASGSLAFIRLHGPAIEDASLLRVRYRPSALHMRFHAPPECPDPLMWIVESKPVGGCYAFSPITTPFGYYGHRFVDVFVHKGAALHFSMWGGAKTESDGAVNMAYAPRIIASNNPKARDQVSSSEGTTVRGVSPFYTAPARSVIQAMRVTQETDGARTYYGYLYDEERQSWRLYTAGQQGARRGRLFQGGGERQVNLELSGAGSFVEVPGPFGVEMSGDIERKMARRIWFYGSDGKFYPVRLGREKADEADSADEPSDNDLDAPEQVRAARNAITLRTADGWILNIMGGMALYKSEGLVVEKGQRKEADPVYLQPEKAKGLFELPVTFGERDASHVTRSEATIDYQITATGPHSKATLYYGTSDCNAHIAAPPPREATEREEAKFNILNNGWKMSTPPQDIEAGRNQFKLQGLTPNTTYYYRLYAEHDDGRSWDYTSGKFVTAK